jgi:hypothetical protein
MISTLLEESNLITTQTLFASHHYAAMLKVVHTNKRQHGDWKEI